MHTNERRFGGKSLQAVKTRDMRATCQAEGTARHSSNSLPLLTFTKVCRCNSVGFRRKFLLLGFQSSKGSRRLRSCFHLWKIDFSTVCKEQSYSAWAFTTATTHIVVVKGCSHGAIATAIFFMQTIQCKCSHGVVVGVIPNPMQPINRDKQIAVAIVPYKQAFIWQRYLQRKNF